MVADIKSLCMKRITQIYITFLDMHRTHQTFHGVQEYMTMRHISAMSGVS